MVMLLSIAPIAANAANPFAQNLRATNAVDGYCGATVELAWQASGTVSDYDHWLIISKSYDGVNFQNIYTKSNSVSKTTSYTYECSFEDTGKTIYLGVAYGYSATTTFERKTISVKIKSGAVADPSQEAQNLAQAKTRLLEALADTSYRKSTENYNGMKFVAGTKAVWECSLYTLTATVTKVSGTIATFSIRLDTKLSDKYIKNTGYDVTAISNYPDGFCSQSGTAGETFTISVNTAKTDPLDYSAAAGGMQFLKISVKKTFKEDWFPVYSTDPNFAGVVANRAVYPENAGYFTEVDVEDIYALGYYVSPSYKLNTNSFNVSQTAITLGIYGFDATVQYKVKGAKKWTQKNFAKNKKITLSGLKANTVYEIQLLCKLPYTDPESGVKKYAVDIVGGKTFTLTTAINAKVQLSSVQISKVKYGTKTVKGYWENGNVKWHPAEKFNTCSYTITIKVKGVPKNAKGLYVKVGGATYFAKGRKTTYTFKMNYQHKKSVKGLGVKCNLYYASNVLGTRVFGFSPARAVSYKLKNSVTKYKK